jgi:hypothetical protein
LQLGELANDGRAGHAHVSGNLGDGKRPAVEIADCYAQADEARFQVSVHLDMRSAAAPKH